MKLSSKFFIAALWFAIPWTCVLIIVGADKEYIVQGIVSIIIFVVLLLGNELNLMDAQVIRDQRWETNALSEQLRYERNLVNNARFEIQRLKLEVAAYGCSVTRAVCVVCGLDVFHTRQTEGDLPIKMCEGHKVNGQ